MVPPSTPQGGWIPAPAQRSPTPQAMVGILVAVVVVIMFLGILASIITGGSSMVAVLPLFVCVPFLFVIVIILVAVFAGSGQRRIPPPPPIQQPMVPAGQMAPVALDCPNCGGPPTNVDRFGVATCSYCGTRFLVR